MHVQPRFNVCSAVFMEGQGSPSRNIVFQPAFTSATVGRTAKLAVILGGVGSVQLQFVVSRLAAAGKKMKKDICCNPTVSQKHPI